MPLADPLDPHGEDVQWDKWIWCAIAVAAEIAGGTYMKTARGFASRRDTALAFLTTNACVVSLIVFLGSIELSVGWAIYTAVQFCGVVLVGVFFGGERMSVWKAL